MAAAAVQQKLRTWKKRAKGRAKQFRRTYLRMRYGFNGEELAARLCGLGLAPGDTVLVHSSLDELEAFEGTPRDLIAVLQKIVGTDGTLLMPTLSFTGTAVEYVRRGELFDVRTSPSQTGLVSELFRRSPGVVRSAHPTHSVAAWGRHAAEITEGHHQASTPCGGGSPYARLLDYGGKILFLGASYESMTFWHTIEEFIEARMPFSPFTQEVFTVSVRNISGQLLECRTRLFDPRYSRARNLHALVPPLKVAGAWHEMRHGRSSLLLLHAAKVKEVAEQLCHQGVYCYDV